MSDVLLPSLAPLDRRVCNILPAAFSGFVGLRAERVAQLVYGIAGWRCDGCQREDRSITKLSTVAARVQWERRAPRACLLTIAERPGFCEAQQAPVLVTTLEQRREVGEILRGLERVGLAYQAGGWWRRSFT